MSAQIRTISRDDELVQQGPNPWTGVASPKLVTDERTEGVGDSRAFVEHRMEPERGKGEGTGKWNQDGPGWSQIESPTSDPNARDFENVPGRAVLTENLEDELVIVMPGMPGVLNPSLAELTPVKMQRFQRFGNIYTSDRVDTAEVDPRQWLPGGLRNRVQNIPRKKIGSGRAQRNGTADSVLIQSQIRPWSLSTQRNKAMRDGRKRIVPLSTPPSNSPQTSLFHRNDRGIGPGLYPGNPPRQILRSINPLSYPAIRHGIDHSPEPIVQISPAPPISAASTSLTSRKYVPRLDFLQSSRFSRLITSYRRPVALQSGRLKPVKTVENTSSGHNTDLNVISGQEPRIEEGSQKHLQNCTAKTSRASLPTWDQGSTWENLVNECQPAITSFLPTTCKASTTALKLPNDMIDKISKVPSSSNLGRADIARNSLQGKTGCVQINEGRDSEEISRRRMNSTTGYQTQTANKSPYQNSKGPLGPDVNVSERVVGQKAKGVHDDNYDEQKKKSRIEGLVHEASTQGIAVGLWRLIALVEQNVYDSIRMRSIQRRLRKMILHVLLTLHTSSPALEVLRMPNAKMGEYLDALKDVARAVLYLLVFLSIFMVVGKVFRLAAAAINLLWLPLRIVLLVARWFILI
ncbi:hypothetical protein MMC07_009448 [Pseudocyphellaria aurata]|nr:hypothetical protein [Pseudocyphellaria aurata]